MKKLIPIYVLLVAILGVFIFQLRETQAMKAELAGIRKEQVRRPTGGGPLPPGAGLPVYVTNEPLKVSSER